MREGDGEAVFLACAGPFGELARRLLADPRPRRWSGELTPLVVDGRPWAVMASFHGDDGEAVAALPLADVADADGDARLARHAAAIAGGRRWVARPGVVPAPAGVPAIIAGAWADACVEYAAIAAFYGARRARRSQVPLIHHIDEGIAILRAIDAPTVAIRAYCLHPLVQGDADLRESWERGRLAGLDPAAVALALEYRCIANGFLSPMEAHPGYDDPKAIRRSPLAEVDAMLIADKIQNAKDFALHHRESHPRAAWLERYFERWLEALEVPPVRVRELTGLISAPRPYLRAPLRL
ncbi:MAG: hypothetical protein H6710_22465 [Myxococcales bacterium]|nr:hypothetical protein [Myxococcales bacterium]